MTLHCLFCIFNYNVVSICRTVVATVFVYVSSAESAPTLDVLDVDGQRQCITKKTAFKQLVKF